MEQEWRRSFYDSLDAELDQQMEAQLQAMIDSQYGDDYGDGDERYGGQIGSEGDENDPESAAYWDRQLEAMCAAPLGDGQLPFDYDSYEDGSDFSEGDLDGEDDYSDGGDGIDGEALTNIEDLSRHFNATSSGGGGGGSDGGSVAAKLRRLRLVDAPPQSDCIGGAGIDFTAHNATNAFASSFGGSSLLTEASPPCQSSAIDGSGRSGSRVGALSAAELQELLDSVYGAAGRAGEAPDGKALGSFVAQSTRR